MSENKITFPVKLASNNPQSFGIVDATEISGHRSVETISDLYAISDPVLSILKDGSDAVGQEWFVVSEDCKYRLDNWENRKSVTGWTKLPKQELIDTKQSVSEKDQPSGYAGLDSNGKLPIEKTYGTTATVVDVETYESLPVTGLSGVIYNVLNTGAQYKWSGSAYIDITGGIDNAKKNETSIFDCSNGTSTKYYSSLSEAINIVPPAYRTSNRIISYLSTENATTSAVNYQYHGIDSTTWTNLTKWEHIPNQADLAGIRSDMNSADQQLSNAISGLQTRVETTETKIDENETAISILTTKTDAILECSGILESGETTDVYGLYLQEDAKGKIRTLTLVKNGVASTVTPEIGKFYLYNELYYGYSGKELSLIGGGSGSGSGSGFFNVTKEVPLSEGFYTLSTAVEALRNADIYDEEKKGMIITFESAEGVWNDYRFIGEIANFTNPAYWTLETDRDFLKGVIFNGEELPKDSAGKVAMNVNTNVEQTVNPSSTDPVSSAAVAAEFGNLSSRYIAALQLNESGEDEDKVYSISGLDEDGNILSTTAEFSGGGGGGGGSVSTTKVVLAKVTENPTVKEGDDVRLTYYYDHRDTATDASTGLQGKATITIISGATSQVTEQTLTADTENTINVTRFLQVGSNTVRVRVEVDNGENVQATQISWRVQVITLKLTSSFDYASLHTRGGSAISIPFNLTGSGVKTLKLYVDGVHVEDRSITTSSSNGSFTVATNSLVHGSHSIQMVAEMEVSTTVTLLSNSIYFDVAVREIGVAIPIVTTRFDYIDGTIIPTGQRPYILTSQFSEYRVNFAAYNPESGQTLILVYSGSELLTSIASAFVQRNVTGRFTQSGQYDGRIVSGSTTYTFGFRVNESDVDLTEPTDNLQLRLSALGRSNNDVSKDSWVYENITTTFEEIQWAGDGWVGNALRLMNNGKATINYKPLSLSSASSQPNAFAFTTKFKVSSVSNTASALISCMVGNIGFVITAEEAKMVTSSGSEVLMKFSSGREYNVAFVSMPIANPQTSSAYEIANSEMLYLFIDGILSGGVQRGTGDNIYQEGTPADITLQGKDATLDVFNVRSYNNYLTADQVLDLFMIDLNTVEDILAKYEFNNITDAEGDVTVDSLPDGMRYVIVTGQQANGMSTVKYAAAMNDKDPRYDVDEILQIVKGDDPSLNFKCVGGCIRLQGTSSLTYPIKNYRLYFRSAGSSSVFGQVYTGVDAQGNGGTLIPDAKPKYSFRLADSKGKRPAPVNVWCLKADFAESSSSHNTGMARMTNDIFVASGNPTPAQKHVDPNYVYDVRTAADGGPCYLFYRNTIVDKPVFVGKYNFNNDKSTEEVFGFLKIPGYHDAAWVQDKFAGENPTECWEFLNNDYPMGMYLEDDFDSVDETGKPEWTKVFEARFPDIQDEYDDGTKGKPQFLSAFVSWVKSTQSNPTKFRNELANYADVRHLCSYFVLTQLLGAVDQMVKNAMLAFWYNPDVDKVLAYYIFYDGDTILGVRNDGRLKYSWDLTRQTLDPELTASAGKNVYAYMGHDSVLWNNLEDQFGVEIQEAYVRLRAVLNNDTIFGYFNKDQSDRIAERVYNLDAQYKYIEPATLGITVISNGQEVNTKYSFLESMQGSRSSHRRWWLENRLDLFDAKYGTGQYQLTDINWKGISAVGAKVTAIMSRDYFAEFKREGTTLDRKAVANNGTYSYTYGQTANIGTIFHLYGGKYFKTLDMSEWGGFTDLSLPSLLNLENLILGRTSRQYALSSLVIGNKMPMLKMIDVTNYNTLSTLDLSDCSKLEQVKTSGCTNMGTITLPNGAPLNNLILSKGLSTLKLVGLPFLQNSGITFPDGNAVINLVVDSCPNINWQTLFTTLGGVQNIRITGINMEGSVAFLDQFKNLGGIDSNGNVAIGPRLVGTYQLTTYLEDSVYDQYRQTFPELNIKQPEYSIYEINLDVESSSNIYNPDNGTGYNADLVIQNNPYIASGHVKTLVGSFNPNTKEYTNGKFHRYLGKHAKQGVMSLLKLDDKDSTKAHDGTSLNTNSGVNGDVWVKIPKYWYKGVSDWQNNKLIACISSNNERPEINSDYVVIKYSESLEGSDVEYLNVNASSLTLAKTPVSVNLFRTRKYMVNRGYSKMRINIAPTTNAYTNVGLLFLDSSNQIVGRFSAPDTKVPALGYVVLDIPTGTEYVYVTLPYTQGLSTAFSIILADFTRFEDWEPGWVEVKEQLINAYTAYVHEGKIRSLGFRSSTTYGTKTDPQNIIDYCTARAFTPITMDLYKDLGWLAVLKYGTFRLSNVLGELNNQNLQFGYSESFGMQDTYKSKYYQKDEIGNTVLVSSGSDHSNFLGIEHFIYMEGPNLTSRGSKAASPTSGVSTLELDGRTIIFTPAETIGRVYGTGVNDYQNSYHKRIMFGKHMDIMPASRGQGSSTTYLTAAAMFDFSLATRGAWEDVAYDGFYALKVPAEPFGVYGNYTNKTIRFGWQRQIELVDDVNQFLNLNDIG